MARMAGGCRGTRAPSPAPGSAGFSEELTMHASGFQNMRLVLAVVVALLSGCAGTYGGTDTPGNTVISIR